MQPSDVETMVEKIRQIADDDETAHGMEDDLYAEVLKAIADGTCRQPRECARIALTTAMIDFSRWCA